MRSLQCPRSRERNLLAQALYSLCLLVGSASAGLILDAPAEVNFNAGIPYDCFETIELSSPFSITVTNHIQSSPTGRLLKPSTQSAKSGTGCFLGFTLDQSIFGQALVSGANELAYTLRDHAGRELETASIAGQPGEFLIVESLSRQAIHTPFQLRLALTPGQVVPPGPYTARLTVIAFSGTIHNCVEEDRAEVMLGATVDSTVRVSYQNEGEPAIDSGTAQAVLSSEKWQSSQAAQLIVFANSPFSVSVSSENRGVLAHEIPGLPSSLSYQLVVAGRHLSLRTRSSNILERRFMTPSQGISIPVTLSIPSAAGSLTGLHTDRLIFEVTAE